MVEQLNQEYAAAGSPVVFVEANSAAAVAALDVRYGRYRTAWLLKYPNEPHMITPWAMADNGTQISWGSTVYYDTFKAMVDAELARPAQAEVSATYARLANHIEADVTITNLSGVDLVWNNRGPDAGILVYEDFDTVDSKTRGFTKRFWRGDGITTFGSLANGATKTYRVKTGDLAAGTNWDRLHVLGFLEYGPQGTAGPYDMLQAAVATKGTLISVSPSPVDLKVTQLDPQTLNPVNLTAQVTVGGAPDNTTWQVTSSTAGFTLTPSAGSVNTQAQLQVDGSMLASGKITSGTITIRADQDPSKTATLTVNVNYPAPSLTITPSTLANLLNNQEMTSTKVATIQVAGNLTGLPWEVDSATTPAWVSLTPSSGVVGASATSVDVYLNPAVLTAANNSGTVHLKAHTSKATKDVPIPISYDPPDPDLAFQPAPLVLFADLLDPKDLTGTLQVTGSTGSLWWSDWTVVSDSDWMTVAPSGKVGAPATVTITASKLNKGLNVGTLTFSAKKYNKTVTKSAVVNVFLLEIQKMFVPAIFR